MKEATKNRLAWSIAIIGISAEIFIATLDHWFDIPHLIFHIGGDTHFTWRK